MLELVRSGRVADTCIDWSSCEGEEIRGLTVEHDLAPLDSACGTPKYTNYTEGFKDCLDYIFYSANAMEVSQVVPFPSEEDLAVHKAIPSVVFPSDHVACVADLKIKRES